MCVARWIQIHSDPSLLRQFTGVEGLSLVPTFVLIVINHYLNYLPALDKVVFFLFVHPKHALFPVLIF